MSSDGKVRVIVTSRKVPIRTIELRRPLYSQSGLLVGTQTSQAVLYENSFDDSHLRAIEEAKKLSCNIGLDLEVVDRSTWNPLRRVVSALLSRHATSPSVVLTPLSGVDLDSAETQSLAVER